jgi:hypothetical protein
LDATRLRAANRASLWAFGLDWLIDYLATSADEVDGIVARCLAVAEGAEPDDPITRFLADLRDGLSERPAFRTLEGMWRTELRLMLEAMAREWQWQAARTAGAVASLPTFDEYLDNADNICFSFVFVSHWIHTADPPPRRLVEEVRVAGRAVQQVIRLLNDLGTYHRDVSWGDLNPLMLGVDRGQVTERVTTLTGYCRELFVPLRADYPDLVVFLDRYIAFNAGFYGAADYWGEL